MSSVFKEEVLTSDLPDRFPRGWFALGHQRDFPVGETKNIFGFSIEYLTPACAARLITFEGL